MSVEKKNVPIPVVPVCFLKVQFLSIIYITIYISISYNDFIGTMDLQFLIGTTGTGTILFKKVWMFHRIIITLQPK